MSKNLNNLFRSYAMAKKKEEVLKKQIAALREEVAQAIAENDGKEIVTKEYRAFMVNSTRQIFDSTAFKADNPEEYKAYCKPKSVSTLYVK